MTGSEDLQLHQCSWVFLGCCGLACVSIYGLRKGKTGSQSTWAWPSLDIRVRSISWTLMLYNWLQHTKHKIRGVLGKIKENLLFLYIMLHSKMLYLSSCTLFFAALNTATSPQWDKVLYRISSYSSEVMLDGHLVVKYHGWLCMKALWTYKLNFLLFLAQVSCLLDTAWNLNEYEWISEPDFIGPVVLDELQHRL